MNMLLVIMALGLLTWLGINFAGRLPSGARIPVAATIMFGLSAYLVMGAPGVAGAPVQEPAPQGFGEPLTDPRQGMAGNGGDAGMWLGLSDGFIRTGRTQLAAEALQQGLRLHPRNVDLWIGFGNALTQHAGGVMTPAAAMAFDKAADIDPAHPGPPFFAGLSLAQSGDVEGARSVWKQLLDRSPANAPWRSDLEQRLAAMPPPTPLPAPQAAPANGSQTR
ncbi:MAG: tetratricopeptide repeat protein [Sphingopyxis sp.]